MTSNEGALLMVELHGATADDADRQVTLTKGGHTRSTYLRDLFRTHLQHIDDYTTERNHVEVERHQNYAIRVYLLMVVDWTIFPDTMLDRALDFKITWASYGDHRVARRLCTYLSGSFDQMSIEEQRSVFAFYSWYVASGYMRRNFRISHPYMRPLSPKDPPMSCEQETLMEEEAEMESPLATYLSV
ncbi:hypothetical protein TSUD_161000 [Trifolium subterraneum]|uniref:Uncharacterized protein n=1 Tax=Trifolium subterraneum TaxID=3900 RepID=A0A2Z6N1Y1_TRISU|nr:hypothetical protein TSUD_161000 [Trifolium subterraneum]